MGVAGHGEEGERGRRLDRAHSGHDALAAGAVLVVDGARDERIVAVDEAPHGFERVADAVQEFDFDQLGLLDPDPERLDAAFDRMISSGPFAAGQDARVRV